MMKEIVFDVMLNDRFIKTFKYKYCPAFHFTEEELSDFVILKLPTLKNKPFKIVF